MWLRQQMSREQGHLPSSFPECLKSTWSVNETPSCLSWCQRVNKHPNTKLLILLLLQQVSEIKFQMKRSWPIFYWVIWFFLHQVVQLPLISVSGSSGQPRNWVSRPGPGFPSCSYKPRILHSSSFIQGPAAPNLCSKQFKHVSVPSRRNALSVSHSRSQTALSAQHGWWDRCWRTAQQPPRQLISSDKVWGRTRSIERLEFYHKTTWQPSLPHLLETFPQMTCLGAHVPVLNLVMLETARKRNVMWNVFCALRRVETCALFVLKRVHVSTSLFRSELEIQGG